MVETIETESAALDVELKGKIEQERSFKRQKGPLTKAERHY